MALQISARCSFSRAPVCTLSRVRADFQGAGVKFKHILSPGSPPAGPLRGFIKAALCAEKFSTTTTTAGLWKSSLGNVKAALSSPSRRVWLVRVALGAAFGVGTVALLQSLHTGIVTAMASKINLNSDGDWKETKDSLLALSVTDRRQHYRTSDFVPLSNIPVWTPSADQTTNVSHSDCQDHSVLDDNPGSPKKKTYQREQKLDQKISLYTGDITKLEVDAIVNAANKTLLGGGGVDGAIHRAAGPLLRQECASLNGCETGEAKITCGYGLPAKYVIHTVGPIARGGVGEEEREALRLCYQNSLKAAIENSARSVAFPCISTGVYGYPPQQAVHVALATVRKYLDVHHDKLDRVIFCVFLPTDNSLYIKNLPLYFPPGPTQAKVKSKL